MNKRRIVSLLLSTLIPLSALAEVSDPRLDQAGTVTYNAPLVTVNTGLPPTPEATAERAYAPAATPAPMPDPADDPHQRGLSLGGPRFGISYTDGDGFNKLQDTVRKAKPDVTLNPGMSQFGWEVEYRMFRTSAGVTALTEFVPLVGGMDQGLALPSATWLVGLRSKGGFELGAGPNFGLDGVAMMVGGGYTFDLGGINLPVNFAVGSGASETHSYAISTGFNL